MSASAASPLTVLGSGSLPAYWRFQRAVARAQLSAWLPASGGLLIDISGPRGVGAARAARAGHRVLRVRPPDETTAAPLTALPAGSLRAPAPPPTGSGRLATVVADSASLAFLADECADGVIAEDSTLSRHLMAEDVAAEIARVLRPGGQFLASVDSLALGMAILAKQHRWAHLTDLPHAEVVLIPWPDGTITRCFGPQQLRELLTEAGLEVNWIRPRTILAPSVVDHVLRKDPEAIARLVRAELDAGADESSGLHGDEAFGIHLLTAARKPR